ncbi:MAG: hydrogenase [Candidatus Omnitrophota bacterium]
MIKTLLARKQQRLRTISFPAKEEALPARFLGRPDIIPANCRQDFRKYREVCPTGAISGEGQTLALDLGRCLFCGECQRMCPAQALPMGKAISFTRDYQLAVSQREDLIMRNSFLPKARALDEKRKKILGRSLKLRQVSAGGCNGCELDINVLNTVVFDLGRFGIQFVASPRHADGILITGPVSINMRLALEKTYQAVPSPKVVIAVGACAISGGPYLGHPEVHNGVCSLLPVDLYIPGCPPHPLTILDGLVRLMGR